MIEASIRLDVSHERRLKALSTGSNPIENHALQPFRVVSPGSSRAFLYLEHASPMSSVVRGEFSQALRRGKYPALTHCRVSLPAPGIKPASLRKSSALFVGCALGVRCSVVFIAREIVPQG
jgi:hypothetical protein